MFSDFDYICVSIVDSMPTVNMISDQQYSKEIGTELEVLLTTILHLDHRKFAPMVHNCVTIIWFLWKIPIQTLEDTACTMMDTLNVIRRDASSIPWPKHRL